MWTIHSFSIPLWALCVQRDLDNKKCVWPCIKSPMFLQHVLEIVVVGMWLQFVYCFKQQIELWHNSIVLWHFPHGYWTILLLLYLTVWDSVYRSISIYIPYSCVIRRTSLIGTYSLLRAYRFAVINTHCWAHIVYKCVSEHWGIVYSANN